MKDFLLKFHHNFIIGGFGYNNSSRLIKADKESLLFILITIAQNNNTIFNYVINIQLDDSH